MSQIQLVASLSIFRIMPRGIYIRVLERNRNAYFLRNSRGALVIIYVFAMFYNLRKYVRVDKTLLRRFVRIFASQIYEMSCAGSNCLRRRFCVEFCSGTCNIKFVNWLA